MRRIRIMILVVSAAFVVAPVASAQTPTEDAYKSTPIAVPPSSVQVAAENVTAPEAATAPAATAPVAEPTSAAPAPAGALPFTGLDLGLIVALAAGLLGLGVFLRRLTRGPRTEAG